MVVIKGEKDDDDEEMVEGNKILLFKWLGLIVDNVELIKDWKEVELDVGVVVVVILLDLFVWFISVSFEEDEGEVMVSFTLNNGLEKLKSL